MDIDNKALALAGIILSINIPIVNIILAYAGITVADLNGTRKRDLKKGKIKEQSK